MKTVYDETDITNIFALRKIFRHTFNGIAQIDLDGQWMKVNNSICNFFGYNREEILRLTLQDLVYEEDSVDYDKMSNDLIDDKIDSYQTEKRYFHKHGHLIWAIESTTLARDEFHRPLYFVTELTDITMRKANEEKLQIMLNVAKEQNDRLLTFADIVTHNLRSHAANLMSLTEFVEEDCESISGDENFSMLKEAIDNLNMTVTHLTEVAKIKSVEEHKIESLNLNEFVNKATYNVSALAKNIGCTIENTINPEHQVKGIPAFLDSILLNFLSNAIKYSSEEREPLVKLSSEIQNDYVVFSIEDNGQGIDLEKYGDKLFHMYKTFHLNEDAIGIGLFITRNHIESLGGKVIVKSEVNVGTEFSVYLKKA